MFRSIEPSFDRSKAFYPYVINYICTLHGLVELLSRRSNELVKEVKDDINKITSHVEVQTVIDNSSLKKMLTSENLEPTVLLGELSLKSQQRQKDISVDIVEVSKELLNNHVHLLSSQLKAAGILLIMGYETTKDVYDTRDELWNFFYHCRNAAAHGGYFNIINRKRFPAKWGAMEINLLMNGSNLFRDLSGTGLLSPGDPIYLLYDIEQTYLINNTSALA